MVASETCYELLDGAGKGTRWFDKRSDEKRLNSMRYLHPSTTHNSYLYAAPVEILNALPLDYSDHDSAYLYNTLPFTIGIPSHPPTPYPPLLPFPATLPTTPVLLRSLICATER